MLVRLVNLSSLMTQLRSKLPCPKQANISNGAQCASGVPCSKPKRSASHSRDNPSRGKLLSPKHVQRLEEAREAQRESCSDYSPSPFSRKCALQIQRVQISYIQNRKSLLFDFCGFRSAAELAEEETRTD